MHSLNLSHAHLGALAAEIMERGGALRFQAGGSSMLPFIRNGDVLWVRPGGPFRQGDVILCRLAGDHVVAHRVVQVIREQGEVALLIQGDSRLCPDGLVSAQAVLGRVTAIERKGKYISFDTKAQRWLGLLWIKLSPFSRRLYGLSAALWRKAKKPR